MKEMNPEEEDGFDDKRYTISDYKIIPKALEEKLQARDAGFKKEEAKNFRSEVYGRISYLLFGVLGKQCLAYPRIR